MGAESRLIPSCIPAVIAPVTTGLLDCAWRRLAGADRAKQEDRDMPTKRRVRVPCPCGKGEGSHDPRFHVGLRRMERIRDLTNGRIKSEPQALNMLIRMLRAGHGN